MTTGRIFWALWWCAGLAFGLGWTRDWALNESPLAPVARGAAWMKGPFIPNGVYTTTTIGSLPRHIENRGSWVGADAAQGKASTTWLKVPARMVRVCVAGYPQHPGCKLWVEFRHANGGASRVECPIGNPGEEWKPWDFWPPRSAVALRVRADDDATDAGGWVAFSLPYVQTSSAFVATYQLAQVVATLALALILCWGPGVLWSVRTTSLAGRYASWVLVGPSLLGLMGVIIWASGGGVRPATLASVLVVGLWLAIGWRWRSCPPQLSAAQGSVLAISALSVIAAVGKATYSGGPDGELYAGTISRTLAVGDRSDARIPFFVVQVATRHLRPAAEDSERYFTPWTFYSRGPLAGLATLPIVLATGARPPVGGLDAYPWQPYDETGYAAYRMVMFVLASGVIVALFAALATTLDEDWALAGASLLALSPFGMHEVMFTWPKWAATAAVVISFTLAHARWPGLAGVALAAGFYYHPMALLFAPWIGLWALGRAKRSFGAWIRTGLQIAGSAALLVLPWMAVAARAPHMPESVHAGHGLFLQYWTMADYGPATWGSWASTRWRHFTDTYIPLRLWAVDGDHFTLSSVYARSGQLVRFAFSWWNSLPFGLGVGLWVMSVFAVVRACREFAAAAWLLCIGPALMIVAYWGAISVGLLRECGHPVFVAAIGLTCVVAARDTGWLRRVMRHRAVPWLQLPETLLMLWLTTFLVPQDSTAELTHFDPLYFAINVAALGASAWLVFRQRRSWTERVVAA